MAELNIKYGTYAALTVTNLQSLANDDTSTYACWQSERVDNRTTLALDYEVQILLSTAASAPAGTSAVIVYVVPWIHNGSAWTPMANFGTTTRPTGNEGTAVIADPNSMKPGAYLPYFVTSQPIDGFLSIAAACGGIVPDGWSLVISNRTGAALGTGCVVSNRPITVTSA